VSVAGEVSHHKTWVAPLLGVFRLHAPRPAR
jgi:hypothetical protein